MHWDADRYNCDYGLAYYGPYYHGPHNYGPHYYGPHYFGSNYYGSGHHRYYGYGYRPYRFYYYGYGPGYRYYGPIRHGCWWQPASPRIFVIESGRDRKHSWAKEFACGISRSLRAGAERPRRVSALALNHLSGVHDAVRIERTL